MIQLQHNKLLAQLAELKALAAQKDKQMNQQSDIETLKDLQATPIPATPRVRPLSEIAREITKDWGAAKKGIYFGAKPYLSAMRQMHSIDDDYGMDSGDSVVRYFLGNAATYRGETAKRVKKELNDMLRGVK